MMKLIFIGLWTCAVALGASFERSEKSRLPHLLVKLAKASLA